MRQLNIVVEAENIHASQELVVLFEARKREFRRLHPEYQCYNLNFIAQKPDLQRDYFNLTYQGIPLYTQKPAAGITLKYSFETQRAKKQLDDFNALEAFGACYEEFLLKCLKSTNQQARVSEHSLRTIHEEQQQMKRFAVQEKARWRDKQFSEPTQTYTSPIRLRTFFPDLKDYYKRQARVELTAAIFLGLFSVPLFFIAPLTATFLAVTAVLLVAAATYHKDKSDQFDNTVYVETAFLAS